MHEPVSSDALSLVTPEERRTEVAAVFARGILDTLARLPAQTIVDEKALAAALHMSPRTIRRLVGRGELPASVPLAGRSVWMAGRVLAFINRKMEKAEAAGERRAATISRQTP